MRYFIIFSTLLVMLLFPDQAKADEMMTVKLVNYVGNTEKITFQIDGDYFTLSPTLSLEKGVKYSLTVKNGKFQLKGGGRKHLLNGPITLIPNKYDYNHRINVNERPYLGAMQFVVENKKHIRPINQLPLEDYLKGVVPFEVFSSWGLETLKAQSLAARTYAMKRIDEVIDDTVRFQAYGGYTWGENTTKAVEETAGEVITYQNHLIDAFYSASNGGYTESNSHVWGGKSLPYFPIKEDPYDPSKHWEFSFHQTQIDLENIDWGNPDWWKDTVEKDEKISISMKNWLQRNGYPGDIKILSIPHFTVANQKLDSYRSVKGSITIEFLHRLMEGTILFQQLKLNDVKLNRIRQMIGGSTFKSYLIDSLGKHDGVYTMKGKGFGHGVGMSQWGAHIMGKQGKSYREIIEFYYPGTMIKKITEE